MSQDQGPDLEARVQELELRFLEQQRVIESLSDVLVEQQRAVDALTLALRRMQDKVDAEPGLVDAAADQTPPHY